MIMISFIHTMTVENAKLRGLTVFQGIVEAETQMQNAIKHRINADDKQIMQRIKQ